MKKCITKKWDGVKDTAKKNSIRRGFFKKLKRVVNAVGHKSTTKAKVIQYNGSFHITVLTPSTLK